MAIYAIGDLQGCYHELQQLLTKIRFDQSNDRLWFVGDMVNRGPGSLECLRLIKSLGSSAIAVLGNHDLHLLAVAAGLKKLRKGDTVADVLSAPDRDELLEWLRCRPLMYADNGYAMVHAGLLPSWTVEKALLLAKEVEAVLCGPDYHQVLAHMYGNQPAKWDDSLTGFDRLRVVINAMTRLRFVTPEGQMEFDLKGEVDAAPPGYLPWFEVSKRQSQGAPVIFGHWSALGLKITPNIIALDSGCIWGGQLTAMRLEDRAVFQVSCDGYSAW
ncbi:MAG: symmetrical bis(5'-nucleosyl)-tetraphosphatase [Pseudomonadota bacterium]